MTKIKIKTNKNNNNNFFYKVSIAFIALPCNFFTLFSLSLSHLFQLWQSGLE
jgi:hypothetical protein